MLMASVTQTSFLWGRFLGQFNQQLRKSESEPDYLGSHLCRSGSSDSSLIFMHPCRVAFTCNARVLL
jgi:hypothetical protein